MSHHWGYVSAISSAVLFGISLTQQNRSTEGQSHDRSWNDLLQQKRATERQTEGVAIG
jgi:hypothetical protein